MIRLSSPPDAPPAYEQPVLEVDVVALAILDDQLKVLLVRRAARPFARSWALPGVRLATGERLDAAARRALLERSGLELAYMEQLYTFDALDRDPRDRAISVAYVGLLPWSASPAVGPGRRVGEVAWWAIDELPPLAFDHSEIVSLARARIAAKLEYAPIAFKLVPEQFTMRQLRFVHEILLGRPYAHENNFWRQMSSRWNIEETGERMHSGGRPAALFRLREA